MRNIECATSGCPLHPYDVANRCGGSDFWDTIRYSYAPGNKRVWRGSTTSWSQAWDELTYYSAGGAKLVAYNLSASGSHLRVNESSVAAIHRPVVRDK